MSVERLERGGGVVRRVGWREGGRNRSKVLGRKRDAEAFDAELKRCRRTGELASMDVGRETLAACGEDWWRLYAEPNLAATTLKTYATMWDAYVLPRLGALALRELTPTVINRFRLELEAAGVGLGRRRQRSSSPRTTAVRGRRTTGNWRRRIFGPAAASGGVPGARPYDLRHSFVSLLIAEGHNIVEIARQAGHSPKMALDTYAHVFDEFDPAERVNAVERIRAAREVMRERSRQPTLFDVL